MSFASEIREEISNLKVWDQNSQFTEEEQIKRVHIRELFLSSGFINDPNKEYHLEIVLKKEDKAKETSKILENLGISSKTVDRNKKYILYIKDGEEISKFLALIGATKSVLKFEEIRVLKEMKNNINRRVNYETANLNKTIMAAVETIEAIEYLKKIGNFDMLEEPLKEVANIRVENPDASLSQMSNMLNISKSGVNHRLRRIKEIAKDLKV